MNSTIDIDNLIENVSPIGLHNPRSCGVEVQTEKPWHREALYMMAAGRSHKFIATELGKTPQMVSILSRQGWFQQKVAEIIADTGGDRITQLLKGAAEDCVIKLMEIRDDTDTPKAVVLGTCKELLDRHLGKAPQHVELNDKRPSGDIHEQMEEVERQLAELRKTESNNQN